MRSLTAAVLLQQRSLRSFRLLSKKTLHTHYNRVMTAADASAACRRGGDGGIVGRSGNEVVIGTPSSSSSSNYGSCSAVASGNAADGDGSGRHAGRRDQDTTITDFEHEEKEPLVSSSGTRQQKTASRCTTISCLLLPASWLLLVSMLLLAGLMSSPFSHLRSSFIDPKATLSNVLTVRRHYDHEEEYEKEYHRYAKLLKKALRALHELDSMISGRVLFPDDRNFAEAASVFNHAFDGVDPPIAVVVPSDTQDVALAVPVLASLEDPVHGNGFHLCIKAGGNNYAGWSKCPNGVVLSVANLENLNMVADSVTEETNSSEFVVARFGPGVRAQDLLEKLLLKRGFGGVLPAASSVAMGGFLLGGGDGALTRKYGLGIDNVLQMEIVLANGTVVIANGTNEYSDLFMAMRGAGQNNYGVVTQFWYRFYPSQNEQLFCSGSLSLDETSKFLKTIGDMESEIPGEASICVSPMATTKRYTVELTWFGDSEESLRLGETYLTHLIEKASSKANEVANDFEFLRELWTEAEEGVEAMLTGNLIQTWGAYVMRTDNTDKLWEDVVSSLSKASRESDYIFVNIALEGGAMGSVDPTSTAFYWRDSLYYILCWVLVPASDNHSLRTFDREVSRMQQIWGAKIAPYTKGLLPNVPTENVDGQQAWGPNLKHLERVKAKYDPRNIFHHEQSIPLTGR